MNNDGMPARRPTTHESARGASLRARRRIALLAAVAAALAFSCSLAVDFDPEGKPCGGPQRECLEGFHCNAENRCVEGEGEPEPLADAGVELDGGT